MLMAVFAVQPLQAVAQEEAELMPLELDGTTWDVEVTFTNKKGKKQTSQDTLVFKDKMFFSEAYEKEGHVPTNYSVFLDSNDLTKFGTMTMHEGEKYFWNGQVYDDNTIRGSLSVLDAKGKTKEYYFKGELTSGILKRKEAGPEATVQEPAEPPAPTPEEKETPAAASAGNVEQND
jgi:hypothetical protein